MTKWHRYLMAAVLAGFLFLLFYSGVDNKKSAQDVYAEMKATMGSETLEAKTRREFLRYYGMHSADVDSFVLMGAANSLDASELLVVKAVSTAQLQTIREAVEIRQKERIASFESYDAEQAEYLRNAVIYTKGKFLMFAVGKDAKVMAEAFAEAVK